MAVTLVGWRALHRPGKIGGPGRDRTDDLFHAMEARSQLRHRPTPRKVGQSLFSLGYGYSVNVQGCGRPLLAVRSNLVADVHHRLQFPIRLEQCCGALAIAFSH